MNRTKKSGSWKLWCASAILAAAPLLPVSAAAAGTTPEKQLNEVFELIEELHISGKTGEELRDAAIRGMLEELNDPYTQYYNEEEWEAVQNSFEQILVGIGFQFTEVKEGLRILKVYADSAADRSGLVSGEVVIGVAGKRFKEYSLEQLEDDLFGRAGTVVELEVMNPSTRVIRKVQITRSPFHIPSVEYGRMNGGAGYIRIESFSSDTAELAAKAMASFRTEPKATSIIVDLRGNPGGYLNAVAGVAEQFIKKGALLHSVDRDGERIAHLIENGSSIDVPVVLLVDENSASASEVFAGAMKDYGLATIIGKQTYGKGSVQSLIVLDNGGGLRITVEHYLTPKRHQVNGVGIAPDIEVSAPFAQTLAAVRAAGTTTFAVTLDPYETVIDGVSFPKLVDVKWSNGSAYVPAVSLAALVEGKAVWNDAEGSVTIQTKATQQAFNASRGLVLENGSSYIRLDSFVKAFPGVKASADAVSQKIGLELKSDG